MSKLVSAIVAIVALLHLYFAWFEIFAWTSRGPAIFSDFPKELFAQTTDMAANQGLYNAFLAAGLIWSLFIKDSLWRGKVAMCFLLMVFVAGVFGAATVTPRIFFVQAMPALLGIVLLIVHWKKR